MDTSQQLSFNEPRAPYDAGAPVVARRTARDWRELHDALPVAELRELSARALPPSPDDALPFAPLTLKSPDYPDALRALKTVPPILWHRGNAGLLRQRAIGLCGSRDASPWGLCVAADVGRHAAETGAVLVTGLARGVDREAMRAVLDAGGAAIGVLAEGWERWTARWLEPALADERLLVLSEFRPSARWRTWQAMQRNETIVLLAKEMYLIEAGERGGTLDAGRRALRHGRRLRVLETGHWTGGNEMLVREGGKRTPRPSVPAPA